MDLTELIARLDKQAEAIKRLRADRDDLTARVQALESGARPSTTSPPAGWRSDVLPVTPLGSEGAYVPNPACLHCGHPKEPGRVTLSCTACAAARTAAVKGTAERPNYTSCRNCSKPKSGGMRMLCVPCSEAFKAYKSDV